jgi:hypothetical protein
MKQGCRIAGYPSHLITRLGRHTLRVTSLCQGISPYICVLLRVQRSSIGPQSLPFREAMPSLELISLIVSMVVTMGLATCVSHQ